MNLRVGMNSPGLGETFIARGQGGMSAFEKQGTKIGRPAGTGSYPRSRDIHTGAGRAGGA